MAYYKPKDDLDKIFFLLYNIEGKAEKWRDNVWKEYEKNPTKYSMYNDFVTKLKKDWGPIDEPGVAMHRLLTWTKMAKQPINQYVARVDQDINLAGVTNDTTKIHLLLLGLPKPTRAQLKLGGAPKSYEDIKQRILEIEVSNYMYSNALDRVDPDAMQVDLENGRGMGNPSPFMEGLVEGRGKGWSLSTPPNPSL